MNGKHVCADALSLLSLSLDEELSPLEHLKLERHLRVCPDCRSRADGIDAITRALRGLPLEAPSVSALPHLPWRRRIARTGFPAAAVLVASFGVVALQGSVDLGSGGMSPAATVPSAVTLSPVNQSLPPQLRPQYQSAGFVFAP